MTSPDNPARWYRNRFVWVAVILLATAAGAAALVNSAGADVKPTDLRAQIVTQMRTTLEQSKPEQHNHAGHAVQPEASAEGPVPVICGVHMYGFEPAEATALADVRKVYGFHLCGVAEQNRPWDVAVKLAGPLIMDMSTQPPSFQVVEATAEVKYIDRMKEMFPAKYAELAQREALPEAEMKDLRKRYDAAAGL